MARINYNTHLLLQSKYKNLIHLIIYLFIIFIYNISFDNNNFIECMMRSSSISSSEPKGDVINNLLQEIKRLNELHLAEKTEYEAAIERLEENQRYLITDNRRLKATLLEAEQTIGALAGDNMELRNRLFEQNDHIESLRRNLAALERRLEEMSMYLINLDKDKFRDK